GIHHQGEDLIIPWDGHVNDPSRFRDMLVNSDIASFADASKAQTILFFIDACREGVDFQTKAVSLQAWGMATRKHAAGRRYARVFGCTPGEYCQYVKGPNGFSLFGRALSTVFDPAHQAQTITELLKGTQHELDRLATKHGKSKQRLSIDGEHNFDDPYL